MQAIFSTLIPIFGIMFVGAFAERKRLMPPQTVLCLNQFVYWFGLPFLIFFFMVQIRPETVSGSLVFGFLLAMFTSQGLVALILRLLKFSWYEGTLAGMLTAFPNTAFMGTPIILLLYPDNPQAYVVAGLGVVMPVASLVLTDVVLSCRKSENNREKSDFSPIKKMIRSLYTNPALIAAALGISIGLCGLTLPKPFLSIAEMIGKTASPSVLFCMGIALPPQFIAWRQKRKIKHNITVEEKGASRKEAQLQVIVIFAKLFLMPFLVYTFCTFLGTSPMPLKIITIMSAMPAAVVCSLLAMQHNFMVESCSNAMLFGTILSMGTIPFVMYLL